MSIQDKRREGFEQHIKNSHPDDYAKEGDIMFSFNNHGYEWYWIQGYWLCWNAALDSVVIELPEEDPKGFGPGDCADGRPSFDQQLAADCNCVLRECKQAIESAGLKVKS